MSDVEITCSPNSGILTVSAETISALDLLGITLARHDDWTITVQLSDGTRLTAAPAAPATTEGEAA